MNSLASKETNIDIIIYAGSFVLHDSRQAWDNQAEFWAVPTVKQPFGNLIG